MLRLVAIVVALWAATPCGVVPGTVVRDFGPVGMYAGHWGVDYAMEDGSGVAAVADGIVTFTGSIAGVRSITVDHGGGLRTSYSYLRSISVERGVHVQRGDVIGRSGVDHGVAALHLSARVDGHYVDPAFVFSCSGGVVRLSPLGG
jgi:murein DD-endopeptidase MepM/ murein hydrolase activator NlpD